MAAQRRTVCNAQKTLTRRRGLGTLPNCEDWQFPYGPPYGRYAVKSALPDDALPGLRRPHGLQKLPPHHGRSRRYCLCLPAMRHRIDPHHRVADRADAAQERPRRLRRSAKPHLFEPRAAGDAIRIGEGLDQLEMIVAFGENDFGRLLRVSERAQEIPGLALELRRVAAAVNQNDRRVYLVDVALGT